MAKTPHHSTPSELAHAPVASLLAYLRFLSHSPMAETTIQPGFLRWRTPCHDPWLNGVLASQPPQSDPCPFIGESQAYFKSAGVERFSWWLDIETPRQRWAAQLEAHGFRRDTSLAGMALDLDQLPAKAPVPPGFRLQTVQSAAEMPQWGHIFARSFGRSPEFGEKYGNFLGSLGTVLPIHYFVGVLEGKPVAVSALFLGSGIAGIYDVGVLPEARKRGLGAAMIQQPLLEARSISYHIAALQAAEDEIAYYKRLGFAQVCEIECWLSP
jgi:GNAT superfamily N-acetyltransferase